MTSRSHRSPRLKTILLTNTEIDGHDTKSGQVYRPPSPELDIPILGTKLRTKITKSNEKSIERAFPTGIQKNPTADSKGKDGYPTGGGGELSIVSKSHSPKKSGAISKIEIRLPEDGSGSRILNSAITGGRYNHQFEATEVRTLLKLPRDTPSAQVVHKLRESFHFMDIVERYRADLQRLLQTKEATTHEGVLRTVKQLLMENESLKQNIDRHQEIIAKLQEDKKLVLERFHTLFKEQKIKDYGSGSTLALTNHDSRFSSQEGGLSKACSGNILTSSANLVASTSSGELPAPEKREKKDLALMLSSKIDHMLKPSTAQKNPEQKVLSPIYIRQKKNKDERKMVYKITGIIRPASSQSSLEVRPKRTVTSVVSTSTQQKKLPEIVARKKTPTPTQRLRLLMDNETASNTCHSSLTSVTAVSTSSLGGNESETASDSIRSSRPGSLQRRIRVPKPEMGMSYDKTPKSKSTSNLVSMSKRYSSSALSASGSAGHQIPPPPSSISEQEESIGDIYGSMSDIKKDDIISLIFAPLLKDRYMSKFSVDSEGGVLTMEEIGISMVIPNGAIPSGQRAEIILGISYNPIDTPISPYAHTTTSSTILCTAQPPDLVFKEPVVLSFSHSSGNLGLSKTKGTPRILQSFTDVGNTTKWTDFSDFEDEGEEEFGCLTSESCVLYLRELRLVAMVMEQGTGKMPSKCVRVVAYVNYSPGRDCVGLNVYCIDSLPSERQLLRRECTKDNKGLEVGEQPMIMSANDGDIIVSIRNIPRGWQLIGLSHQSLSYRKVWQNLHPHVTFLLQCAPDTWDSELSCSIHTQQLNTDEQDSATDIAICCDLAQIEGSSDCSLFENGTMNSGMRSFLHTQTGDYFTPNVFDAGSSILLQDTESDQIGEDLRSLLFNIAWPREVRTPNIPPALVSELASMLNPPNLLGLDWRQLATELDLDACVPSLTAVGRATEHLLLAAEVLCSGLYELQSKLERMGRDDTSSLVRAYIARMEITDQQKRQTRISDSQPLSCRF